MSIVSIITARGGSKSIYKKNIIECNGLPLLAYPLKASQNTYQKFLLILTANRLLKFLSILGQKS